MTEGSTIGQAPLTENQQRRLKSGLQTLRESLARILEAADPPQVQEQLHLASHDLSPIEAALVRERALRIAEEVDALAAYVGASPIVGSSRQTIAAHASYAWTVAQELHPRRFKEVGEVEPLVIQLLSGRMERLASDFLSLAHLLDRPSDGHDQTRESGNG